MITRRGLIATLCGGFVAAPLAARAQQVGKVWRIGFLGGGAGTTDLGDGILRQRLRELGYEEGQNLIVEYRWSHGRVEAMPQLAAELVRLNVDLIVVGGTSAALAARNATKTIPIVFAVVPDPVATGLVASLARPGGNITGLSTANIELAPKRLQLLTNVSRRKVTRVSVVVNPVEPSTMLTLRELEEPARTMGITLRRVDVRSPEDFEGAFSTIASERADAIFVTASPLTNAHAKQVVQLAARTRLPAIYNQKLYVEAGGLMSYAVDVAHQFRRAAVYVDRILKGTKPADLPVELPTKFELTINLKAARALGLTIPQSVLARADRIID